MLKHLYEIWFVPMFLSLVRVRKLYRWLGVSVFSVAVVRLTTLRALASVRIGVTDPEVFSGFLDLACDL